MAGVIVVLMLAAMVYWKWPAAETPRTPASSASVIDILGGGDTAGFARALAPRPFSFPADYGPHNDFRQEWWYYTGNLQTAKGRHFGYQLTFFRFALAPDEVKRNSAWATRQIYLAHFALTDVQADSYLNEERVDRAALGLAGAQGTPYKVWLEDWIAQGESAQGLPMHLRAASSRMAIDLHLESLKPVVLQGDKGLSQKGGKPGNASYYYSLTRLAAQGTVRVDGKTYNVSGLSWMDREWSTSALEPGQVGWDWFALQLSNRRELMFYRLRRKDDAVDSHSRGIIVDADGAAHALPPEAVDIVVTAHWQSPHSGVRYPAGWTLKIPAYGVSLEVTPYVADQEFNHRFRYWEGAVHVAGLDDSRNVKGNGYVELVGYGRPISATEGSD
jgi:predicted secreted hydrolase